MAIVRRLLGLTFVSLALKEVNAQRNTCPADDPAFTASGGANCIRRQLQTYAAPYCSSVLSLTTPTSTSTRTTLDTTYLSVTNTRVITAIGTPPITTTLSGVTTINDTTTFTETTTTITGTFTTYIDTTTVTDTSYSNVYTCDGGSSSLPPSASLSGSISTSFSAILPPSSATASSIPSLTASISLMPNASSSLPTGSSTFPSVIPIDPSSFSFHSISIFPPISSFFGTGTAIPRPSASGSLSSNMPPFMNSSSSAPSVSASSTASIPSVSISASESPSASGSLSASASLSASITASASMPYYYPPLAKRQTFEPIPFTPRCLRRFVRRFGSEGLSDACECLAIATPTPITTTVTTADPATTVTSRTTFEDESTTTETPTITTTQYSSTTLLVTTTTTLTESALTTLTQTSTSTTTLTSTITQASPTPTVFNLYYTNPSTDQNHFFAALPAPGGSGIVLTSQSAADAFTLDSLHRLVDTTGEDAFIARNTEDLYPFNLLQTTAATGDVPVCEVGCGGVLRCDYPGTRGNVFALCYGFLALGPRGVFGQDADGDGGVDCVEVVLRLT